MTGMKKKYVKPEIIFMKLKPEERLAACDWPVGFMASDGSCQKTWAQYPAMAQMCTSLYNNAPSASS